MALIELVERKCEIYKVQDIVPYYAILRSEDDREYES